MKLVVKNLEYMQGTDGIALNCDIYHKGVKLLHAHDDGRGGCLDFHIASDKPEIKLKYNQLQTHVKSLPKYDFNAEMRDAGFKGDYKGEDWREVTMEDFLNNLINDAIDQKESKKVKTRFNRDAKKGVLYGTSINSYSKFWWKGYSLAKLAEHPKGREFLQTKVDDLKKKLKDGDRILNTEYIKSLGIKV